MKCKDCFRGAPVSDAISSSESSSTSISKSCVARVWNRFPLRPIRGREGGQDTTVVCPRRMFRRLSGCGGISGQTGVWSFWRHVASGKRRFRLWLPDAVVLVVLGANCRSVVMGTNSVFNHPGGWLEEAAYGRSVVLGTHSLQGDRLDEASQSRSARWEQVPV